MQGEDVVLVVSHGEANLIPHTKFGVHLPMPLSAIASSPSFYTSLNISLMTWHFDVIMLT